MKNNLASVLLALNIVVLLFMAASPQRDNFEKITVKEFELVDAAGKQRVSIKIEEGEEVVFRIRDKKGEIRLKMGAGENGSGIVLLDENTNPGVHMLAKKTGSSLTLTGAGGKKKEF
jgi:hypothetical protein